MMEENSTDFTDRHFFQGAVFDAYGNQEESLPLAVVDTSFLAAALLSDYCSNESRGARFFIDDLLCKNGQIVVPQIFWYEIGNVLLNACRPRKNGAPSRITSAQLDDITLLLGDLPVYTDSQPDAEIRSRIMNLSLREGLSYYDASYLELARRKGIPLKTFDEGLIAALH